MNSEVNFFFLQCMYKSIKYFLVTWWIMLVCLLIFLPRLGKNRRSEVQRTLLCFTEQAKQKQVELLSPRLMEWAHTVADRKQEDCPGTRQQAINPISGVGVPASLICMFSGGDDQRGL